MMVFGTLQKTVDVSETRKDKKGVFTRRVLSKMWLGAWCLFWTGCSVAAVAAVVVAAAAVVDFVEAVANARPNQILVANCDWGCHQGMNEKRK